MTAMTAAAGHEDYAATQQRVVEVLRSLSARSEEGILSAGSSLSRVVAVGRELAQALVSSLGTLRSRQQHEVQDRVASLEHAVVGFVSAVTAHLAEERVVVRAVRAELDEVMRAAVELEGIASSSRMLAVCAAIETSQLDNRTAKGRFSSTVMEMRKLATLVEELRAQLVLQAAELRAEIASIERSGSELAASLDLLRRDFSEQTTRVNQAGQALLDRLDEMEHHAGSAADAMVQSSLAGLTALQFQDPMIQELQRLDALVGLLREGAADDDAPMAFAVNLGDRASVIEGDEDEDSDEALDAGELLLF